MNIKKSQKGGGFIVVQVIMQFFAAIVMIIFNLAKELVLGFLENVGQSGGASGVIGEVRRKFVKYMVSFLKFCFLTSFIFMMFILGGPTILMISIIYGYFMLYRNIKEFDKKYAKTLR